METLVKGVLLDINSKEYEINDKIKGVVKGISHKIMVKTQTGEYVQVSIKYEEIDNFKHLIGEEIELICKIFVKGTFNLKYLSM